MTRLFILFYLSVLAVLVAAWYIHGAVARWQFGGEFRRVVEGTHRGGTRLVVQRLDAAGLDARSDALSELQRQFDYPLAISTLSNLPDRVQQQFAAGRELVHFRTGGVGDFVAAPLKSGTDAVLLGPFPRYAHYEDSLAGGMRLAVHQLQCVDDVQREAVLQDLETEFGYDVQIVSREDLTQREQRRLATGEDIVFFLQNDNAFVAAPLADGSHVVQFGPFPNFEGAEQRVFATTLALVLVVAAMAIALLLRPMARQLRYVENAAYAIAGGDLTARVDEERVTSAKPLAQAFNEMATRTEVMISSQRELLQAVSHELRTPLSRIRFAIDLIESADSREEQRQRLESLDAATEELDDLVDELLQYVRLESTGDNTDSEPVSLRETVERLAEKYAGISPNVHYEIHDSVRQHGLLVRADAGSLQRVLSNLLANAGRFAATQVCVRIEIAGQKVAIDVDDDGSGIAEGDRERVFEPFVRLDDGNPGKGVGLGLALVKRILERHNGSVQITESPLGGCRVRTWWECVKTPHVA